MVSPCHPLLEAHAMSELAICPPVPASPNSVQTQYSAFSKVMTTFWLVCLTFQYLELCNHNRPLRHDLSSLVLASSVLWKFHIVTPLKRWGALHFVLVETTHIVHHLRRPDPLIVTFLLFSILASIPRARLISVSYEFMAHVLWRRTLSLSLKRIWFTTVCYCQLEY